jgi:hypothetical protein
MPKHLTQDDAAAFVAVAEVGAVNGIAQLGSDGKVPTAQLPPSSAGSVDSVNGMIGNVTLTASNVGAVDLTQKGAASGVAQLDSTSHLVAAQLPTTALTTAQMGAVLGVATLDNGGKLSPSQVPAPAVASVNGHTGAVALTATDVGAVDLTQKGAASGVATLDSGTKIPVAQIPSLLSQYQPVPGATPTKAGQVLSALASGSNSAQWKEPLTYTATSAAGMPTGVPAGSLCTRTDTKELYEYVSSAWVLLPYAEPWRTAPLKSGIRGYNNNESGWVPKLRRRGSQVFLRGRMELTAGGNFPASTATQVIVLPSDCVPTYATEVGGTATTAGASAGAARFQVNPATYVTDPGTIVLYMGTGPTPATPWIGIWGSYWID